MALQMRVSSSTSTRTFEQLPKKNSSKDTRAAYNDFHRPRLPKKSKRERGRNFPRGWTFRYPIHVRAPGVMALDDATSLSYKYFVAVPSEHQSRFRHLLDKHPPAQAKQNITAR